MNDSVRPSHSSSMFARRPGLAAWLTAAALTLGSAAAHAQSINVNAASVDELSTLERIGRAYAERIVEERDANGPFADAEDLIDRVSGVGPAFAEANEGRLDF